MDFMRTSSTLGPDPDIIDTRTQAAQDYHHHTLLSPVQGIPPALKPISGDDDDSDDDGDGDDDGDCDDEDNDDEDDDSRGNGDGCGHGGETSGNNVGLFTAASSAQSAAGAVKDGPIQDGLSSEHVSAAGIAPNADEDGTPALTDSDSYSQSNQPKLDWEIPLPPSSDLGVTFALHRRDLGELNVLIFMHPYHFALLPARLRNGATIPVVPALFTQGVNEQQTFANLKCNVTNDTHKIDAQVLVNDDSFMAVEDHCKLFKEHSQHSITHSSNTSVRSIGNNKRSSSISRSDDGDSSGSGGDVVGDVVGGRGSDVVPSLSDPRSRPNSKPARGSEKPQSRAQDHTSSSGSARSNGGRAAGRLGGLDASKLDPAEAQFTGFHTLHRRIDKKLDVLRKAIASATPTVKHFEILELAADLTVLLGGGRVTCCKSAKDRTSMSVTRENTRKLVALGLDQSQVKDTTNLFREYGVRIRNAHKNAGKQKYAFNVVQRKLLPKVLRPPIATIGSLQS
jgi:hypothetical protein